MIPQTDCIWKCKNKKCGHELSGYMEDVQNGLAAPRCRECGGEMDCQPLVHRGPGPDNPFKKY